MASFGGTKEASLKFMISRYHNGRFYFDRPVDITRDIISKLTGLSNQGNPVPIRIKEGLVQELTGSPSGKNSKGLMIGQIATRMPQIVAKIIAVTLTLAGEVATSNWKCWRPSTQLPLMVESTDGEIMSPT